MVSARAVAAERALDVAFGVGGWSGPVVGGGRGLVEAARRVADAESRAAVERYRLERFKARRLVRVGLVLRDSVRPREWVRLPGRLRGALVRGCSGGGA